MINGIIGLIWAIIAVVSFTGYTSESATIIESSGPTEEIQAESIEMTQGQITLTAADVENGSFRHMTVSTGEVVRTFDWQNVDNPTYAPAIRFADVNGDGEDEAAIICTTGTGTGVHIEELHLLRLNDLAELDYESPLSYVAEHVSSSVGHADGKVTVTAGYGDQKVKQIYEETDSPAWFDKVAFQSVLDYEVEGDAVTAFIDGNVSPAQFAVRAEAEYGPDLKVSGLRLSAIE